MVVGPKEEDSRLQLSSRRRLDGLALGRPVAFGIALIIVWWAVTLLFATGLPRLSPAWFPDLRSTLVNLGALLVPLAVVAHWAGGVRRASHSPGRTNLG